MATQLIGFILDKGIVRGGERVLSTENEHIGIVTSAGYSPVLRLGIGLAYVQSEHARVGAPVLIEARKKRLHGRLADRPFIKK